MVGTIELFPNKTISIEYLKPFHCIQKLNNWYNLEPFHCGMMNGIW